MKNIAGYLVAHDWYTVDYEDQGTSIYPVLFSTEQKAQEHVDWEMAHFYNEYFDNGMEGLRFDSQFNQIVVLNDYNDEMTYDDWRIVPIYTEEN